MTHTNKNQYDSGTGQNLVLLHGVGAVWDIWKPLLPLLTPHYRVVALPLPGHLDGNPIKETKDLSISLLVDQITEELATKGITSAHFVGNAFGGWLALELARRDIALSVTAFSPAGGWRHAEDLTNFTKPMTTLVRFVPKLKWLLIPLISIASLRKLAFAKLCRYGHKIPATEARKMLRGSHYCSEILQLLERLEIDGAIRQIPEPGIPICIIWSEHDRILPLDQYSRPLMLAVPYAKLEYLHDAGHMPTYDQPENMVKFIMATIEREQ